MEKRTVGLLSPLSIMFLRLTSLLLSFSASSALITDTRGSSPKAENAISRAVKGETPEITFNIACEVYFSPTILIALIISSVSLFNMFSLF
ncbi:MAG: hypothetical protein BWY46_01877 [Firmicutes bacterium ADurb.Bin300]|nr:MAG: hypothetical protein BWY46_01877 [Firmicutes bacterium ADurb.Bin300]